MPGTEAVMDTDRGNRESASMARGTPEPRPALGVAHNRRPALDGVAGRRRRGRRGRRPVPLRERDESDPERRAVELAQRGRIILDVSIADLEAAEAVHGAFHPIAWHFRNACNEARRSWERLRAELGTRTLEAALERPPLVILPLGEDRDGSGPGAACRAPC